MLDETTTPHILKLAVPSLKHLRTAWRRMAIGMLFGVCATIVPVTQVLAETVPIQAPIAKGVLLVASPSMEDPNFRHTVVLIVEHGPEGTMGFVLNRPTDILLSQALPEFATLKNTDHRLFLGGPVAPDRMTVLARLGESPSDVKPVIDGVYIVETHKLLERLITQPKPTEAFRVFAGMAGWAPGQLDAELRQGAWAMLRPDAADIFDRDPANLWTDSLQRLQAPMVISHETPRR